MHTTPDPITRYFEDDGKIPNNPALPVVILKAALDPTLSPDEIHAIQRGNGWGGNWVWSVFDYHHWHPDAHEALCVASGEAELMLGGAGGEVFRVVAGDTLVLPAGTGHCRLSSSADFAANGRRSSRVTKLRRSGRLAFSISATVVSGARPASIRPAEICAAAALPI